MIKSLLKSISATLFFFFFLAISQVSAAVFTANDIAGDLGDSYGVSIVDVNGDGHLDIYLANNSNQQNKLWINNGSGVFTANDIAGDLGDSWGSAIGDVNGDGHPDIYVVNQGQQNKLWINNGSGVFTANDIAGDIGHSVGVAMGDVNGDGHLDIYVANFQQQNKLWINNGSGVFTANDIAGDMNDSLAVNMGDVNGDGHLDIYVANNNGQQNKLWINSGTGSFTASDIAGDTGNSWGVAMGDVNGDGHLDIYVANFQQQNKLWINSGTGSFTASDIAGDTGNSWGVAMGDVNGDGHLDIYVANISEQNRLWISNGSGVFTASDIAGDLGFSAGVAMGDVNGDGLLDIYVSNGGHDQNQQNRLWINNTPIYTVTYNGNGSTGGTVPVDGSSPYAPGTTVTVLGNTGTLVRTGFTFNNWNTAANGSGTNYAPTATFTIPTHTTLYAQWTALPISINQVNSGGLLLKSTTTRSESRPVRINPTTPITTTLCFIPTYLNKEVRYGSNNNPDDVKMLEGFLNTYENMNLPVDGVYSISDRDAVIAWQEKYASEILTPFGITKGTGNILARSLAKIRQIHEAKCTNSTQTTTTIQPLATTACYTHTRALARGVQTPQVLALQKALQSLGFIPATTELTGFFGPATFAGVTQFQTTNSIEAIGVVGPLTGAKLNQLSCGV